MENTSEYKIKEHHLKSVLEHLSQFKYSDIHWVMLILENLEPIVKEQPPALTCDETENNL